jgi:hypothetical protein
MQNFMKKRINKDIKIEEKQNQKPRKALRQGVFGRFLSEVFSIKQKEKIPKPGSYFLHKRKGGG